MFVHGTGTIMRRATLLLLPIALALGLGAIMVALVSMPTALRKQWLLSRQRKEIASLNATLKELQAGIADPQGRDQAAVRADRTTAKPTA